MYMRTNKYLFCVVPFKIMLSHSELVLSLPTTIFSILSIIASGYVCISTLYMRHIRYKESMNVKINNNNNNNNNNSDLSKQLLSQSSHNILTPRIHVTNLNQFWEKPEILTHHVFFMSFADCIFSIFTLLSWFPLLWDIDILGPGRNDTDYSGNAKLL